MTTSKNLTLREKEDLLEGTPTTITIPREYLYSLELFCYYYDLLTYHPRSSGHKNAIRQARDLVAAARAKLNAGPLTTVESSVPETASQQSVAMKALWAANHAAMVAAMQGQPKPRRRRRDTDGLSTRQFAVYKAEIAAGHNHADALATAITSPLI